jgi:hypothetical protein
MCVHALHSVHALPDLRISAGRLRDGCRAFEARLRAPDLNGGRLPVKEFE